jgi:transcription antitermination factor NusG
MYWTVAQTEPRREHIARMFLMREGYETYAPRCKIKGKITLLFPSYLFVKVAERWYPIVTSPGISQLIMTGETPARLPESALSALRRREGPDGFVRLPRAQRPGFHKGQPTRIVRGNFAGHLGLFERMSGPERCKVLLALLGGRVSVELPLKDVTIVSDTTPCV